jgi:hypothetical protein
VVPDSDNSDDLVVLARLSELTAAQLLCGRLDAEGIEAHLPDEIIATQAWHFHGALGGIRVQVRRADLERAKEILAQPGMEQAALVEATPAPAEGGVVQATPGKDADDGTISSGDRAAFRALRVALVSLWVMGLVHPYSLWLAARALGGSDITAWGRRRARVGLVVSLVGCAWLGFLVYRFAQLSR